MDGDQYMDDEDVGEDLEDQGDAAADDEDAEAGPGPGSITNKEREETERRARWEAATPQPCRFACIASQCMATQCHPPLPLCAASWPP